MASLPWVLRRKPARTEALKDNKGVGPDGCDNASNEQDPGLDPGERTMLLRTMNNAWRHGPAGLLCCCLLFVVPPRCEAQNLVPNHSFEEYEVCPYTTGFQEGDRPTHWRSWLNSPDYFHACAGSLQDIDTLVSVPHNGWGFQHAWGGEAYVGYYAYSTTDQYREYIGAELLEPLEVGEIYHVSFRTNMAWDGNYWYTGGACNNMGLLFTMTSNAWEDFVGPPFLFRNHAHLYSPTVITDTVGWTLVSGAFVADSAYRYVVLGNFFENALTDTLAIPPGGAETIYYFVDDVHVCRQQEGCDGTGVGEMEDAVAPWAVLDPASGDVLLTWHARPWFSAEVVDMAGRVVGRGEAHSNMLRLQATSWSTGIYIARLWQGQHREFIKFVLSR